MEMPTVYREPAYGRTVQTQEKEKGVSQIEQEGDSALLLLFYLNHLKLFSISLISLAVAISLYHHFSPAYLLVRTLTNKKQTSFSYIKSKFFIIYNWLVHYIFVCHDLSLYASSGSGSA